MRKSRMIRRMGIVLVALLGVGGVLILQHGCKDWKGPLERAVAGADRLELAPTLAKDQIAVFEITGEQKVRELIDLIEIDPWKSGGRCKCCGDTAFRFYKGGKHLVTIGFAHGEHLKWQDGPWSGDALLTPRCQRALPQWFKDQGYAALEDARLARLADEQKQAQEDQAFADCFPPEVRDIVLGRALTGGFEAGENAGKEIARKMGDPKAVAVAVSCAFAVSSLPMSATMEKERRALAAASTVDAGAFLAALEQMRDERKHLRGAARLFFWERLGDGFPKDEHVEWAARLAEVVFSDGLDEDKPLVLQRLSLLDDERIRSLLQRVADGQCGTEIDQAKAYGEEPGLRAGALLCLALQGDRTVKSKIEVLLPGVQTKADRTALQVSLMLLGDHANISKESLTLESYLITRAAIKGIEQFHGVYGMDALVEGGSQQQWALLSIEAGEAFDRITGQRFSAGPSNSYRWEDAKAWWKQNRERWLQEHKP